MKRGITENAISPNMLADHRCSFIRETPTGKYKKQKMMMCVFDQFFYSQVTVYRDTVPYLTVYAVI
jgi:hypothetical protein